MNEYIILLGITCFAAGFIIAFWLKGKMLSQRIKTAEGEASRILEESKRKAETLIKEADLEIKDKLFKMKSEFDADTKDTRFEFKKRERRIIQKEENIEQKTDQLEKRDRDIFKIEKKSEF